MVFGKNCYKLQNDHAVNTSWEYRIVLFICFFFPSSPLNFEVYFVLCICSSGRASSLIYMQVMASELDQVAEWLKENAPGANNVRTITIR